MPETLGFFALIRQGNAANCRWWIPEGLLSGRERDVLIGHAAHRRLKRGAAEVDGITSLDWRFLWWAESRKTYGPRVPAVPDIAS
jgi:hypothetical protein